MLCREEGFDLSSMAQSGELGKARLLGLVKEIAPCATAKTDEELGVAEFQEKYFGGFPLYLDENKVFYQQLGSRKITSDLEGSWNPLTVWKGFTSIGERIKAKNLEGNFRGEGLVLGGILVISPKEGVVYSHKEQTGKEIPRQEIIDAVKLASGSGSKSPFSFF